ncbi:MAG: peptidyl-prolyl cis-trans isomerase [Verrucomicrobiota bacterium]|nr:peptidyl-prolyl cis-trans isomerase [Verrucomicrobiota bacterium]
MKGMRILPAILLASALPAAPGAEPVFVDGAIAYVNSHAITLGDVQAMVAPRQQELFARHKGKAPEDQIKKLYDDGLNVLIERYLILDSHKEQEGKIPAWAVDQEVEAVIRESFKGDRSALMAALSKDQVTFESWKEEIENHIVVSSLRSLNVGQNVKILPEQVERYYGENPARYIRPAQARLSVIVLKKEADHARAADAVRQRLAKGEDFGAVAKEASQGANADEGGDWGWVALEDLRPELQKAIAALKPGEISDAVETSEEVYIAKLGERKAEGPVPLQEVQAEIEQELRKQEAERLYHAWIEQLKRKAYVTVLDRKE